MSLIYRMASENDIDALVSFWSEHTGWDQIDRTEWERRFYHTPFGPSAVVIAIDEKSGQLKGQIVFVPTQISVDGVPVNSRRPYAFVLHKDLRSGLRLISMFQIAIRMYNCAIENFKHENVGLIHMMPDPGWVRAFKFITNSQIGNFPLWSLPLPLQQKFEIPGDYEVRTVTATDEQLDSLWEKNSRLYGCSFVRNTKTLWWKTSHGDYRLLGIYRNGELVGFSSSIVKEKDKQWLFCDMLTADSEEVLEVTLNATCNAAHDYVTSATTEVKKVAIMATPLIEKKIENIGFQKDNYKFPILVQVLDDKISKKQVAPERWYASAND